MYYCLVLAFKLAIWQAYSRTVQSTTECEGVRNYGQSSTVEVAVILQFRVHNAGLGWEKLSYKKHLSHFTSIVMRDKIYNDSGNNLVNTPI